MDFWKLHGSGNDFILIDNRDGKIGDLSAVAQASCHRHFGVGADGLMAVEPSSSAEVRMVYYNSDGSLAAMCGNGIRCFAKFVKDAGILTKDSFLVETGDGIKEVKILSENEKISQVQVDMGSHSEIQRNTISMAAMGLDREIELIFMHLGVPHAVILLEDGLADLTELTDKLGPLIEKHPAFPVGTNVNFVQINQWDGLPTDAESGSKANKGSRANEGADLTVSTWERGAGRTLACGTGACAAAVAALWAGAIRPRQRGDGAAEAAVHVRMPGGEVTVTIAAPGAQSEPSPSILLSGPAELVCKGNFFL